MKTVRGVQKNGLGVRCTLQQELGRVGWVCTVVRCHARGLPLCLVFLLGVFALGDDLRMASAKTRTPKNSVQRPVQRPANFQVNFPSKFHTHHPRNNPQKKNIKVKGTTRLTHLEHIYTLLPPHSRCLVPNGDETTTVQDPLVYFSSVLRDFCR